MVRSECQDTQRIGFAMFTGLVLPMVVIGCAILVSKPGAAEDGSMPSGEEVLQRYLQVTGGRQSYEKLHSVVSKKSIEIPAMQFEMDVTTYKQAPDKFYRVGEGAMGKIENGYDGQVAWRVDPMRGAQVLKDREKDQLMREAVFNPMLNWHKIYKSLRCTDVVEVEEADGQPCYKVVQTTHDGMEEYHYFSKESGRLVKSEIPITKTPSPPILIVYEDYRKEGPVSVPHVEKHSRIGVGRETIYTLKSVEYNTDIPSDRFSPPASIQALLDSAQSSTSGQVLVAPPKKPATPQENPGEAPKERENED